MIMGHDGLHGGGYRCGGAGPGACADRRPVRAAEPRARVREYLAGLVAGLERKNGWTLAERAGEVTPDGMQRLLRHADWDTREVHAPKNAWVAAIELAGALTVPNLHLKLCHILRTVPTVEAIRIGLFS